MERITDLDGLYHLDPSHSEVGFSVRHAGLSRIRGTFDAFHGYAIIDRDHVEQSAMMVRISTSSINTKQKDRDAHLRNADFFDVATYPTITFVGTSFRILHDEDVLVGGDLTIRDTTRPLELTFSYTGGATDPFGNQRIGFEASLSILRSDYGLRWNAALETGGWMISDEVRIEIEASAVKQAVEGQDVDLSQVAAPGAQDTVVLHGTEELDGVATARGAIADDADPRTASGVPAAEALPEEPVAAVAEPAVLPEAQGLAPAPAGAPAPADGSAPRRGAGVGDEAPVRGPRRGMVVEEEDQAPAAPADQQATPAVQDTAPAGVAPAAPAPEPGAAAPATEATVRAPDGGFVPTATPAGTGSPSVPQDESAPATPSTTAAPATSGTPDATSSSDAPQSTPAQDETESGNRPWWRRLGRRG